MKLFKIALLCLLTVNSYAVTETQTRNIYSRLIKDNNIVNAPKLQIVDYIINSENEIDYDNAGTIKPWSTIYITKQKLYKSDKNTIAFILGHELGHGIHRHIKSNYKTEFEADQEGSKISRKSGYNYCKGSKFLKGSGSKNHPAGNDRRKALGCI